ncbi:MAG: hypothetical protein KTR30_20820, partial [Saprospiraceae bacterium]|nr:hypothetical protein [Saprospiraceae bacterium]
MPFFLVPFRNLFFSSPQLGANKLYQAAFDPQFAHASGIYIIKGKVKAVRHQLSAAQLAEMLS